MPTVVKHDTHTENGCLPPIEMVTREGSLPRKEFTNERISGSVFGFDFIGCHVLDTKP